MKSINIVFEELSFILAPQKEDIIIPLSRKNKNGLNSMMNLSNRLIIDEFKKKDLAEMKRIHNLNLKNTETLIFYFTKKTNSFLAVRIRKKYN